MRHNVAQPDSLRWRFASGSSQVSFALETIMTLSEEKKKRIESLSIKEMFGTVNNPVITEDKQHHLVFQTVLCGTY